MVQEKKVEELPGFRYNANLEFWATLIPMMTSMGIVAVIFISCVVMKNIIDRHNQNVPDDPEANVETNSGESDYCPPLSNMDIPRVISPITSPTNSYSEDSFQTASETESIRVSFNSSAGARSMPNLSPISSLNTSYSETRSMPTLSPIKIPKPISPITSPANDNDASTLSSNVAHGKLTSKRPKEYIQTGRHMSHLGASKVLQHVRRSRSSIASSLALQDQSYDDDSVFFSDDRLCFQPIDCIPSERVLLFQDPDQVVSTKPKTERCASWPQASNIYNRYTFQELNVSHLSETGFKQQRWGNSNLGGKLFCSSRVSSLSSYSCPTDSCENIAGQNILVCGGISDHLKKFAFNGLQYAIRNPL